MRSVGRELKPVMTGVEVDTGMAVLMWHGDENVYSGGMGQETRPGLKGLQVFGGRATDAKIRFGNNVVVYNWISDPKPSCLRSWNKIAGIVRKMESNEKGAALYGLWCLMVDGKGGGSTVEVDVQPQIKIVPNAFVRVLYGLHSALLYTSLISFSSSLIIVSYAANIAGV